MKVCISCRERYFGDFAGRATDGVCEICGIYDADYEVDKMDLKDGLVRLENILLGSYCVPVFVKESDISVNLEIERLRDTKKRNNLKVARMHIFEEAT